MKAKEYLKEKEGIQGATLGDYAMISWYTVAEHMTDFAEQENKPLKERIKKLEEERFLESQDRARKAKAKKQEAIEFYYYMEYLLQGEGAPNYSEDIEKYIKENLSSRYDEYQKFKEDDTN
jgi:hypothetical protein